jgi:hypothetical protein
MRAGPWGLRLAGPPTRRSRIGASRLLRLREHSCPIRTGDILFDVAVNPGDGTLYAVGLDARFSGFGYDTIALTQSTDGGQSWSPLVRIDPGSDAGARVDDRQAFTPVVHVGDEGTVTVTFYDFRNNTAADGMLATDQWAVRCRPASEDCSRSAGWNEETRATPGDSGRLGCALGPGPGSIPSAECARPRRLGRPPPTRRAVAFASPLPIFAVGLVLLRLGTGSPQRPSRGRLASMAPRALDRARQPQPRSLNARLHLLRSCGHVRASGGLFSTPGLDEWRPSVRRLPSAAAGLSCFARMPRGT